MSLIDILQSALYLVMNTLLYPVAAALLFLIIAALFMTGGFVSEALLRRKQTPETDLAHEILAETVARDLSTAGAENAAGHLSAYLAKTPDAGRRLKGFLRGLARHVEKGAGNFEVRAEKLLSSWELDLQKALDKTRLMIRIGPMLGLMGTLIPMGPALLSLSQGDLTQMANCLVLAFGTTVSGLAVGILAYVVSVFRERWHAEDIGRMEYIVDLMVGHLDLQDRKPEASPPPRLGLMAAGKAPS